MAATAEIIENALIEGFKGAAHPILAEDEAKARAALVWAALNECGLQIDLTWKLIQIPGSEPFAVPIYSLPEAPFNIDHGTEKPLAFRAGGTGLNEGDLFKLARACMLRAKLIPHFAWTKEEKERFADHDRHIALIEELLWLGRFRNPREITRDYSLRTEEDSKNIDFRFHS